MFECHKGSIAVDIPSDVKKVEKILQIKNKFNDTLLTLIFDCDGVVLNSNHIKTRTFYDGIQIRRRKSTRISEISY